MNKNIFFVIMLLFLPFKIWAFQHSYEAFYEIEKTRYLEYNKTIDNINKHLNITIEECSKYYKFISKRYFCLINKYDKIVKPLLTKYNSSIDGTNKPLIIYEFVFLPELIFLKKNMIIWVYWENNKITSEQRDELINGLEDEKG